MLDDALKTAMNAPHEAALRFALWMIAIALLMMLRGQTGNVGSFNSSR